VRVSENLHVTCSNRDRLPDPSTVRRWASLLSKISEGQIQTKLFAT
jgi:hypothetical protein